MMDQKKVREHIRRHSFRYSFLVVAGIMLLSNKKAAKQAIHDAFNVGS